MQKALFLFALLAGACAAATICPATTCDSSLAENTCATYAKDTDTWKIKKCATGKHCNVDSAKFLISSAADITATCADDATPGTPPVIKDMYPGYPCTEDSNCALTCSSGSCAGLAENAADCVVFNVATTASYAKMCGGGLYCNGENKCVKGLADAATCTANRECSGRSICQGGKCAAPASIAADAACTSDYYCASGLVCTGGKCAAATEFASGKSYGMQCSDNAACGAKGSCTCTAVNKVGDGTCSLDNTANTTYGKAALDTLRNAFKGASFNCPLGWPKSTTGGCAGTMDVSSLMSSNYDSCFNGFKTNDGDLVPESTSSSYGLFVSVFGFVAYLLA